MAKKNKILDGVTTVVTVVLTVVTVAAIGEVGYLGGAMLTNDVECTVKEVKSKINPIEMRRPHWYSKKQPFNTRTNKFVEPKKNKKNDK